MVFYTSVFRELAELHKVNASKASEAEEVALSRETQAKEQLSLALEKAQEEARIQQEALAIQVTQFHAVDMCQRNSKFEFKFFHLEV